MHGCTDSEAELNGPQTDDEDAEVNGDELADEVGRRAHAAKLRGAHAVPASGVEQWLSKPISAEP